MDEGLIWRLLSALAYVLPAYVANGAPVVAVRLVTATHPLDFGKKFVDGRRLLGDGKTLEGLVTGLAAGSSIGALMFLVNPAAFRHFTEPLLLSAGAMLGDVMGSFVKRRAGMERGAAVPIMDQLGFLVTSLLLCWALFGTPRWADPLTIALLMAVTGVLHVATNAGAYLMGLKDRWY
ncbi:MAG: CDP-2,3-bis-(O-geranylgeranyl)-sn-glycerol synthase [Thaumarchaeota archaeon]|nr:CDP-2,3-bis-(O-geranylgeranyl)-sn-glycerol synthase [Candidatus Calditenuaceae archaeon]MDW8187287.1 CDP-2,3-bis-(O-geranylgeranyl)-sn-glycerol synthase [Nitrososphaerota archaeon]